jgi:hypothetical protein
MNLTVVLNPSYFVFTSKTNASYLVFVKRIGQ